MTGEFVRSLTGAVIGLFVGIAILAIAYPWVTATKDMGVRDERFLIIGIVAVLAMCFTWAYVYLSWWLKNNGDN